MFGGLVSSRSSARRQRRVVLMRASAWRPWVTAATTGYEAGVTNHSEAGAVPMDDEAVEEPPAVNDVVASRRDHDERGGSDQSHVDPMAVAALTMTARTPSNRTSRPDVRPSDTRRTGPAYQAVTAPQRSC